MKTLRFCVPLKIANCLTKSCQFFKVHYQTTFLDLNLIWQFWPSLEVCIISFLFLLFVLGNDVNSWRGLQLADMLTSACSRGSAKGRMTDKIFVNFRIIPWYGMQVLAQVKYCVAIRRCTQYREFRRSSENRSWGLHSGLLTHQ